MGEAPGGQGLKSLECQSRFLIDAMCLNQARRERQVWKPDLRTGWFGNVEIYLKSSIADFRRGNWDGASELKSAVRYSGEFDGFHE